MTEELTKLLNDYFDVLEKHGRTPSNREKVIERVVKVESKFFPYLDDNDQYCIFCNQKLVVLAIHVPTGRPHWGCLTCRFEKGTQKIKWLNHCAECGKKLNLDAEQLAYQEKYLEQDNVETACDECVGHANILKDEDMKDVHKKQLNN